MILFILPIPDAGARVDWVGNDGAPLSITRPSSRGFRDEEPIVLMAGPYDVRVVKIVPW